MAFSNGYTYRKKITVDATKVSGSGSLTDFPVLVSHTDAALKTTANGGKVENASGYDIRFETSGGTELDYERLFYSATTGQIIAWVQATIDGTTSTEIYVYYGNSSISTDQSDPTGTWDANFKGVWHMIEDPSGSAPQLLDSTSNNYDMTTAGTMTSGDLITGQVYKAIDFDGTDDEAKNTAWASVIDENDAFTIEHWFNISSTPNAQMVAWGEAGANNLASTGTYGNEIGYLGYANDHVVSAAPYDDGAWHHLVVTHDGSTMKVLIDGSQVRSDSTTTGINASQDLYFARWKDGGFYPAKLEEIRISTGARSNDWAITTYETAKNPSTFYSLGTEETSGGTAYDIVAASGSFTLTGQTAGVTFQAKVVSDRGTFNLTGQNMSPLFGPKVTADQGAYSLSGQNAGLNYGTTLALESGVFTLTGQDVTLQNGYGIIANQGSFTLSGQDVTLNMALTEVLTPGSFVLTGQDMTPRYGTSMTADQGSFALTGQDVNFTTQYVILTETGGFVLTGQNAGTLFGAVMSGETGAFTLNGIDTALPISYTINAEKGTITLTGNNVNFSESSPSGAGNIIIGIAL